MPIYKKVNKKFFKKWSSEMTYVLGFIFADGNIILTKRKTWFLSLQITDKDILEKIKYTLGSSHVISKKKKVRGQKQLYRLQIGSKEICGDLMILGITPKKSHIMEFPSIPSHFFIDFLRGYFDGDGGVWFGLKNKKQIKKKYTLSSYFTSGSRKFLVSLKNNLQKYGILGGSLVKKERGFELKYSVKNTLILYKIMYNDTCPLFLKRKKDRFEKYIQKCDRSSTG